MIDTILLIAAGYILHVFVPLPVLTQYSINAWAALGTKLKGG